MRLEAAERFARGEKSEAVARDLRVTSRSVRRWRREWHSSPREEGIRLASFLLPVVGTRSARQRHPRRSLSRDRRDRGERSVVAQESP
uniref:helix-turn-helix domain-containing protein n=1 Tax=Streptomyces capillispiralis TaxID=68182 RepID=UPI00142F013C|nr:helix-turn-helix domain-containing protein [Streptomyces capillispiralis]